MLYCYPDPAAIPFALYLALSVALHFALYLAVSVALHFALYLAVSAVMKHKTVDGTHEPTSISFIIHFHEEKRLYRIRVFESKAYNLK